MATMGLFPTTTSVRSSDITAPPPLYDPQQSQDERTQVTTTPPAADRLAQIPANWSQIQLVDPATRYQSYDQWVTQLNNAYQSGDPQNINLWNKELTRLTELDLTGGFQPYMDPSNSQYANFLSRDLQYLAQGGHVTGTGPGGALQAADFSGLGLDPVLNQQTIDQTFGQAYRLQDASALTRVGLSAGPNQVGSQELAQWFDSVMNDYREAATSGKQFAGISDLESNMSYQLRSMVSNNPGWLDNPRGLTLNTAGGGSESISYRDLYDRFTDFMERSGLVDPGAYTGNVLNPWSDPDAFGDYVQALPQAAPAPAGTPSLMPTAIQAPAPFTPTVGSRTQAPSLPGGGGAPSGGGIPGLPTGGGGGYSPRSYDFNFDIGGTMPNIPSVGGTLGELYQGRSALVTEGISNLQRMGPLALDRLHQASPELGAAAQVARGAFGGDFESSFQAALSEAASARGVDVADIASFDASLAAEVVQGPATQLAARTGIGGLQTAGFAPPSNLNFQTLGSLNMQQARLQAEIQAGVNQSLQAQSMFSMMLPGLLDASDPFNF